MRSGVSLAPTPFAKGTCPAFQRGMAPSGRTDEGSEGGRKSKGEDEEIGKPKCAVEEGKAAERRRTTAKSAAMVREKRRKEEMGDRREGGCCCGCCGCCGCCCCWFC